MDAMAALIDAGLSGLRSSPSESLPGCHSDAHLSGEPLPADARTPQRLTEYMLIVTTTVATAATDAAAVPVSSSQSQRLSFSSSFVFMLIQCSAATVAY
jgi:hypothetical protein